MRQKFKDKEYFTNLIINEKGNIELYKTKYLEKKRIRGNKYKGPAFSVVIYSGLQVLIASKYTLGDDISKLVHIYRDIIPFYINTIDKSTDYSQGGDLIYTELLRIISLGHMFEAHTELKALGSLLGELRYEDKIISYLLKDYMETTNDLIWSQDKVIQILSEIVESSKDKAVELISTYLNNYFYTKENLEEEFNSHKKGGGYVFSGYWSWEAGAIVKLMGLDDSSFKDNPYYPYDLVHWQD